MASNMGVGGGALTHLQVKHVGMESTASLVRLLREAESGKGLGVDYAEALGEALGHNFGAGTSTRPKGRGLRLRGRVPSIGTKRCAQAKLAGLLKLISREEPH